jgi:hypothetical protein
MVEAGRFNPNQRFARFRMRQFLHSDLNHLGTACAERASNTPLYMFVHDESSYHSTQGMTQQYFNELLV